MHICYVTHRYPPQSGGVETHVRELATRMAVRGHDVTVISADAGGEGHRREFRTSGDQEHGVHVRRVRAFAPGGNIHVAPGVISAVRRAAADADVVHVHNYHSMPFALGGLTAAIATDAKLVATPHYHGGSGDALRDRLLALYRPLGAATIRRADAVLAVSDWERRQLADDFGVAATVIPNGVYCDRFVDAEPYERDADTNECNSQYLLSVGRLEEYKGVQHLIAALPELPEYDLLVAGSGSYREELERRAREAGVADRVEFLGYVDSDRLPRLYAGAAAHVTLSSHEAYGMTVAESIAAGTPVVVRESGALVDWTRERGVVGVGSSGVDSVSDSGDGSASESGDDSRGESGDDSASDSGDDARPVESEAVAAAVRSAVEGSRPNPDSVPTWDTVADRVESVYEEPS
jgi:glycosyltransferase involved in cell wall biosynthesis